MTPEREQAPPIDRRRVVVVGTVAAVLIAAAGVTAWAYGGDVPRGTRVLGVDLGGKSRSEAEHALTDAIGPRTGDPVKVNLAGRSFSVAPAAIALTLRIELTVGRAIKAGGPKLTGERTVPPVIELDRAKLAATLRARLDPAQVTLKKPGIAYAGLTPRPSYPAAGQGLDPVAAAAAIRRAWLVGGTAEITLVGRLPATTAEQVDALVASLAVPAVAAPVTVTVEGKSFTLTPAAIARGLVFRADEDGLLTPAIDGARLHAAAAREFAKVEREPAKNGQPRIVAGDMVDLTRLGTALLGVLPNPAPRAVDATLTKQ